MMEQPVPLTNAERAAIIVMLLGEEEAAGVLSRLEPGELQVVGEKMVSLGEIGPDRIAHAIAAFIKEAENQSLSAGNRIAQLSATMESALGPVKAQSLMQRIAPEAQIRSLELARWLSPEVLLSLVEDEHAQAIAVLLLLIETESAAELLASLPEDIQPAIVERVARIGPVSAGAVEMIDELLEAKIAARFGQSALKMGGAREAAELINNAVASVGKTVIPVISGRDADLAKAIEAEMFTFEMILALDSKSMGRLLRDVESEVLIDALKGLAEEERDPVFAAMSSRAADGVKDEIEMRGKLPKKDVLAAQKSMIAQARALADAGEISFGGDDGDFV